MGIPLGSKDVLETDRISLNNPATCTLLTFEESTFIESVCTRERDGARHKVIRTKKKRKKKKSFSVEEEEKFGALGDGSVAAATNLEAR